MKPENPLVEKLFNEYEAHFADSEFDSVKFFANHPDHDLATYAADLLIDQYSGGKQPRGEVNYARQAYRLLNELKYNVCDKRLRTEKNMDPVLQKALLEARASFAKERNR